MVKLYIAIYIINNSFDKSVIKEKTTKHLFKHTNLILFVEFLAFVTNLRDNFLV